MFRNTFFQKIFILFFCTILIQFSYAKTKAYQISCAVTGTDDEKKTDRTGTFNLNLNYDKTLNQIEITKASYQDLIFKSSTNTKMQCEIETRYKDQSKIISCYTKEKNPEGNIRKYHSMITINYFINKNRAGSSWHDPFGMPTLNLYTYKCKKKLIKE